MASQLRGPQAQAGACVAAEPKLLEGLDEAVKFRVETAGDDRVEIRRHPCDELAPTGPAEVADGACGALAPGDRRLKEAGEAGGADGALHPRVRGRGGERLLGELLSAPRPPVELGGDPLVALPRRRFVDVGKEGRAEERRVG